MKFLLIDGNAVLHRAYYAMPDWRNRSGEATAGVYGFLSILLKAIDELKPTHLGIVFDHPSPTFRHLMYVGYQTNREKERQVSEDIWGQVDKLTIVFEKMGIPVFRCEGFEADDVIGTIAEQATKMVVNENEKDKKLRDSSARPDGLGRNDNGAGEVVIITGDRDLMQLVNDKVKLFMPLKGMTDMTIIDEEKVVARLGVHPDQVIDYKGLVGDSSDNYPGVTGIGPKTAIHLLAEFNTLEGVYKNLDKIGEKISLKLVAGYEAAMLSQKLATIRKDAPVTMHLEKMIIPDQEKILDVLKELGYRSLIKRISGEEYIIDDKQQKLFE